MVSTDIYNEDTNRNTLASGIQIARKDYFDSIHLHGNDPFAPNGKNYMQVLSEQQNNRRKERGRKEPPRSLVPSNQ